MLKNLHKQNGSSLLVVIIILAVAILGALGYVVWSNYIAPKTTQNHTTQATTAQTNNQTNDLNKGYLVLEDWGVKFKIPDSLTDIKSYKLTAASNSKGITDYYEFTTQRVEDLGGQCAGSTSNGSVIRLDSLDRTQTKQDEFASTAPANDNEPIANYYYYVSGGQSTCADQGTDIQTQDRNAIYTMLLSPIAL